MIIHINYYIQMITFLNYFVNPFFKKIFILLKILLTKKLHHCI
ncbi:MAG: hypothetical protein PWP51_1523 [Clostridiales bacterium]|jgi:hypothetical protein|nr:hypothetical protein [Clostridiales bacterium]MDN5298970.1 hypothetical protein [Clostridiales bacterium]